MKKRVICLLVLCIMILSNTAFAANWVYIGRDETFHNTIYVDKDSITKQGDKVIYWELMVKDDVTLNVLDKGDIDTTKKVLMKWEAITSSPRQDRQLEIYVCDLDNQEVGSHRTLDAKFSPVDVDTRLPIVGQIIDFALQNSKEGKDKGQKPSIML
ncbi:MAG: hypothetical protein P4N59_07960 [Negativicutes bacterium]|nr:hypothetical protein [Negativicutes bacterium]